VYLFQISSVEEQQSINSMSVRYGQEVNLDCEKKHGGMLRYSPGSDQSGQKRYEDELRSKMGTRRLTLCVINISVDYR
jgi:hypothetical protein